MSKSFEDQIRAVELRLSRERFFRTWSQLNKSNGWKEIELYNKNKVKPGEIDE